jgi:hypothetical protein
MANPSSDVPIGQQLTGKQKLDGAATGKRRGHEVCISLSMHVEPALEPEDEAVRVRDCMRYSDEASSPTAANKTEKKGRGS